MLVGFIFISSIVLLGCVAFILIKASPYLDAVTLYLSEIVRTLSNLI
jgi:hypothetical protein